MASPLMYYALVAVVALALSLSRSWQTAVLLALVELIWVCLCASWGVLFLESGDVFFLYWACVLLFFSAVELVVSAILFIKFTSVYNTLGPSKKR